MSGAGAHTSGSDSWVDTTTIPAVLTITGRVGIAHDRTLWYFKGGAAGADVTYNDTGSDPGLGGDYEYQYKHKRWGYLLGGGVEHALNGKWSLKAEFDYMNFGSHEIVLNAIDAKPGQPTETFTSTLHVSQVLVGLNYRF
jgi:outer membrane immunogenic protein